VKASELIKSGARTLRANRHRLSWVGDEADQATELLEHALGGKVRNGAEVPSAAVRKFERYIERRSQGEPLPYIVGYIEFLGARMLVRPGTFVPRMTSEFTAESAITKIRRIKAPIVVDAATGVGPMAIAIARAVPRAKVYGTDIAGKAVLQARRNAIENGVKNVTFLKGSMFDPLPKEIRGKVDLITSHPPYVPKQEIRDLPDEVRAYEPVESLTDDSRTGMRLARMVVEGAVDVLRPGGWLLVEIGVDMARPLRALYREFGFNEVKSTMGEMKYTRVMVGRR